MLPGPGGGFLRAPGSLPVGHRPHLEPLPLPGRRPIKTAPIRVEALVNASHRTFAAPPALPYALGLGFSTCSRCPYKASQRRAETTGKALVRVGTSVLMLGGATPNHRVVLAKNVNFKKK